MRINPLGDKIMVRRAEAAAKIDDISCPGCGKRYKGKICKECQECKKCCRCEKPVLPGG